MLFIIYLFIYLFTAIVHTVYESLKLKLK